MPKKVQSIADAQPDSDAQALVALGPTTLERRLDDILQSDDPMVRAQELMDYARGLHDLRGVVEQQMGRVIQAVRNLRPWDGVLAGVSTEYEYWTMAGWLMEEIEKIWRLYKVIAPVVHDLGMDVQATLATLPLAAQEVVKAKIEQVQQEARGSSTPLLQAYEESDISGYIGQVATVAQNNPNDLKKMRREVRGAPDRVPFWIDIEVVVGANGGQVLRMREATVTLTNLDRLVSNEMYIAYRFNGSPAKFSDIQSALGRGGVPITTSGPQVVDADDLTETDTTEWDDNPF